MKKILAISNIIIPILSFILLFFFDYSDNIIYIILMTLFIGWIIPFINLIITGISILNDNHHKLTLVFNIFSAFLNIVIIFLIIKLYEHKFIIMIIEYSLFLILNILNSIYFMNKVKLDNIEEQQENKKIKNIKEKNNGIIK